MWRTLLPLRSVGLILTLASFGHLLVPYERAFANDTEVEIGVGGLVLKKNANIEMRFEDLYVSSDAIRVKYRFYNNADTAVTTHVAFPLPGVVPSSNDNDNLQGLTEHEFSTRVNRVPVKTQIEQRATVSGVERTDVLKRFGIPLDPTEAQDALDRLPRQSWDELTRAGLAELLQYHSHGKPGESLTPLWTLTTTYYWKQTFPAKKEITIEHSYRPVVGGYAAGIGASNWTNPTPGGASFSEDQQKYCIEADFVQSAKRIERQRNRSWGEKRISYILTTGGNWAGPIHEFRLVVGKGDPQNLMSFCAEGMKRITATQFEVRKKNYVPSRDLDVLILTGK